MSIIGRIITRWKPSPNRRSALVQTVAYLDLFCAVLAGGLWYLFPAVGPWPLAVALTLWPVRLIVTRRLTYRTPFDWLLLTFLATAGLSIWAAYDKETAWAKFWLIVGSVLLYYAFANGITYREKTGGREGSGSLFYGWVLAFFGAGVAVYFLATHDWEQYPGKIAVLTSLGRTLQTFLPTVPGHRLHPNVVGGLLAMSAPFAGVVFGTCVQAQRAKGAGAKDRWAFVKGLAALGLLGLTLFGLLMSNSRGAWLALAVAVVIGGMWAAVGWRRGRRLVVVVALVTVLSAGLVVIVLRPDLPVMALNALSRSEGTSRLNLYQNSLLLVEDYPLIGAGLGGYMMLYSSYALLTHVGFSIHAHNLFLNIAIEQGLPAVLALVLMLLFFVLALWREAKRGQIRPLSMAAALAVVVILTHGLVDDVLYGSRALLLLFVPFSFVAVEVGNQPLMHRSLFRRRAWLTAVSGAVVIAGFLLVPSLRSVVAANLAAVQQSRMELAVYDWPEWSLQDEVRRELNLSAVTAGYEQALELNPNNTSANRRLGQIELSLGEYEDALGHLRAAYVGMPWENAARQLYGEALVVNGRVDEGVVLWATVNNAQNQLGTREFWYEYIGDVECLSWVRQGIDAVSLK